MHGCLRTLCAGYGLYAVGNTVLLILLYFTDYKGALGAAAAFAVLAGGGTALSLRFDPAFYGFGFLAGAAVLFLAALLRLDWFTRNLPYRGVVRRVQRAPGGGNGVFRWIFHRQGRTGGKNGGHRLPSAG